MDTDTIAFIGRCLVGAAIIVVIIIGLVEKENKKNKKN